jgi:hypothetical protein
MKRDRLCGLVIRIPGYRSRGPGFDSWRYQIFWEVMDMEQGSLSRGASLRWPRDTLYPLKLALISPTSGGHSVGIVRLRTKATEFVWFMMCMILEHTILKTIYFFIARPPELIKNAASNRNFGSYICTWRMSNHFSSLSKFIAAMSRVVNYRFWILQK